ncbi:maleylpyruvate isomerase N-terminal domain-containing protein [Arthrobacter sp. RIT-PI-e]|uniref:maleylpyruvate isomerase N-terminal domain-containing protein n=1 Tax=Arthrobacter sp. RIT-PI-e TaxID=1681197 RepID=UPI0009E3E9F1|nr:maleylpyruvate isomerase N-terminal domain-containing protein [Arthrobacter sp. RIT-PI-e]
MSPEQWTLPSLCPGWDIHDVVAHPVDCARTTRPGFVRQLIAARFDVDVADARGIVAERAAGFSLRTLDSSLHHGAGPEVLGSSPALLLAVSGRRPGEGELSGDGAAAFIQGLGEETWGTPRGTRSTRV